MNALKRTWPGSNVVFPPCFPHFFAYGVLLFVLLGGSLFFQGVHLQEGRVAPYDVVARETIEVVDAVATEKRREEALAGIPPVYRVDDRIVRQVQGEMERFFAMLEEIRGTAPSPLPESVEDLSHRWNMTPGTLLWLLEAPQDVYEHIKEFLQSLFTIHFFSQPVRQEDVAQTLLEMNAGIERAGFSGEAMWIVGLLVTRFLRPNAVVDEARVQEMRLQVLESLEPVRRVIRRGEVLLRKGEVVTQEHMQALRALGMVSEGREWFQAFVIGVLVTGMLFLEYFYFRRFVPRVLKDPSALFTRLLIVSGVLVLNLLTLRISPVFLVIGAIPLVLFALLGKEVALGESLLLFPLLLWTWQVKVLDGALLYVHLVFPLFFLGKRIQRRDLIRAGGMLSLFGVTFGVLFALCDGLSFAMALTTVAYGAAGGVVASVIALGSMSLFESVLHFTTDVRLVELLNPNHPLLKKLMFEAPGTYSHSLAVANLAEVAAEEVGANTLLARVGAYYHDIGKLKRPYCFIENQLNPKKNIHNRLSPYLSVLVITSHVRDGLEIAREFRLPQEIQNIIQSHHGRSVVRYFYEKALRTEGGNVNREVFRYPGPLPRTPEEAIVFLADSVEAAIRSARDPTPRQVEMTVRNIIRAYLEDGQLDESSLTLQDITRIARRFTISLNGMIHARVPYPEPVNIHGKG